MGGGGASKYVITAKLQTVDRQCGGDSDRDPPCRIMPSDGNAFLRSLATPSTRGSSTSVSISWNCNEREAFYAICNRPASQLAQICCWKDTLFSFHKCKPNTFTTLNVDYKWKLSEQTPLGVMHGWGGAVCITRDGVSHISKHCTQFIQSK